MLQHFQEIEVYMIIIYNKKCIKKLNLYVIYSENPIVNVFFFFKMKKEWRKSSYLFKNSGKSRSTMIHKETKRRSHYIGQALHS